jgi:hypothetical protein
MKEKLERPYLGKAEYEDEAIDRPCLAKAGYEGRGRGYELYATM